MTGDKIKFISLKERKDATISFRNNGFANIIGTCTIKLGGKDATTIYVFVKKFHFPPRFSVSPYFSKIVKCPFPYPYIQQLKNKFC